MIFLIITIAKPFKHNFTHILSTVGQKQTKGLCATLVDILQRICKKKIDIVLRTYFLLLAKSILRVCVQHLLLTYYKEFAKKN
jgi:hypothetical protein